MSQVLPLAVAMMMGPGIMASIIFVTNSRPVPVSALYVLGVLISTAAVTAVMFAIATLIGSGNEIGESSEPSTAGKIVQFVLILLLALAAVKNWVRRETIEPPKWLGSLMTASPGKALKTGLAIIPIMISDLLITLTVGFNLVDSGSTYFDAIPFIALTALVAALPLIGFLLFHRRARAAMPQVRDWMNTHSWLINIIVCVIFILLIA